MKEVKRTRSRSFTAETPEEFDEKYNMISDELSEMGITMGKPERDGSMYHIFYTYMEMEAESAKETYELAGNRYYCKDCPFFKLGENKKHRSAGCSKDIEPNAVDYTPACEMFYTLLAKGAIKARED